MNAYDVQYCTCGDIEIQYECMYSLMETGLNTVFN